MAKICLFISSFRSDLGLNHKIDNFSDEKNTFIFRKGKCFFCVKSFSTKSCHVKQFKLFATNLLETSLVLGCKFPALMSFKLKPSVNISF